MKYYSFAYVASVLTFVILSRSRTTREPRVHLDADAKVASRFVSRRVVRGTRATLSLSNLLSQNAATRNSDEYFSLINENVVDPFASTFS